MENRFKPQPVLTQCSVTPKPSKLLKKVGDTVSYSIMSEDLRGKVHCSSGAFTTGGTILRRIFASGEVGRFELRAYKRVIGLLQLEARGVGRERRRLQEQVGRGRAGGLEGVGVVMAFQRGLGASFVSKCSAKMLSHLSRKRGLLRDCSTGPQI